MDLSDNDKQRIVQAAKDIYGFEDGLLLDRSKFFAGAEYEHKYLEAERSALLAKVSEQEKEIARLRDALEKIDGYAKNVRPLKVIHDIITEAIL